MQLRPLLFITWLLIVGSIGSARAQSLFPVRLQGKWGLIDANGEVRVPGIYNAIGEYQQYGYATMQRDGGVGLLDQRGEEVVPPDYADLKVIDSLLFAVMTDGEWRVINQIGEQILAPGYQRLRRLPDGRLTYRRQDKWGMVDPTGKTIVPARYEAVAPWGTTGLLRVELAGRAGLYDAAGRQLLAPEAAQLKWLEGLICYRVGERWGALDPEGRTRFEPRFESVTAVQAGYLQLRLSGRQFLYRVATDALLTNGQYQQFLPLGPDRLVVQLDQRVGLINGDGHELLPPDYEEILLFAPGSYRVRQGPLWGVVSEQGKILSPIAARYIAPIDNGVALVRGTAGAGLLGQAGHWLLAPEYDKIEVTQGQAKAHRGTAVTVVHFDARGQLRDQAAFDRHFSIKIGGSGQATDAEPAPVAPLQLRAYEWFFEPGTAKWGLRSLRDGSLQIPPTFDRISVDKEAGFTIVGLRTDTEAVYERTHYRYGMVFGLVRHADGLLVTEMNLLDLRWSDFREGLPVVRCVLTNGRHGLLDRTGKLLRTDYAYIGRFEDGLARISIQGKLSATLDSTRHALEPLRQYQENLLTPYRMIDYTAYDQRFEQRARLTCEDCSWGYMDTAGKTVIPTEYAFARPLTNGVAMVACEGKWGALDAKGRTLIPCRYDAVSFLENTDQQVIKVYRETERFGLIDTLGRLAVDLQYEEIGRYAEGRLAVQRRNKWGFVDARGREVIPCRFQAVQAFSEGVAAVKLNNKWGYIDKQGSTVLPFEYEQAGAHSGGYFPVKQGMEARYVDERGADRLPDRYEAVTPFDQDLAWVRLDNKWGLIDRAGKWLARPRYLLIRGFEENGLALVRYGAQMSRYGLVDRRGQLVTPANGYAEIRSYYEGYAAVKVKEQWGFLDRAGQLVIAAEYDSVDDFSEGKVSVQRGTQCGYIERSGRALTELTFSKCFPYKGGKAVVYRHARETGLIDTLGQFVIQPELNKLIDFNEGRGLVRGADYQFYYITEQAALYDGYYEQAGSFRHGVAVVQKEGRWGVINQKGIEVIPPKYDRIDPFEEGYARVGIQGFTGLTDLDGNTIVQPTYEYVSYAGGGLFRVERGNTVGYVDAAGNWIWDLPAAPGQPTD